MMQKDASICLPICQTCLLEACVCNPDPMHHAPPLAGAGLSHCLFFTWYPPPHVVLHASQSLHIPHCPSEISSKCRNHYLPINYV